MKNEIKTRIEQMQNGEVPQGYKKTKVGIVPRGWEVKKLCEISKQLKEKAGCQKFETLSISAGIGFVNQAEKFGKELAGKQYVNYTIIKKGDFSYNKGNSKRYPQGCIYMLDNRDIAAVPNVFNSFSLVDQHSNYFRQLFVNGYLNKQLYKYINSGVRNDGLLNLYDDDFYSCRIPIPPLLEQQRIADILSLQDRVIELKEKLIEQKEKQKKHLMQNLLTGKIRLKGFNGEWEKVRTGAVIEDYCKKTTVENQYPVLTSSRKGLMLQSDYYTNRQVTTEANIGYFVLPKGYITFRSRSDDGKFVFNENNIIENGIISYFYPVFKVNRHYSQPFILDKLNQEINRYAYRYVEGTAQKVLSNKKLKELNLTVPPLLEQTAIAEILSTADREIELLKQDLTEEKQKKKALMQLLLTGIVRV